MSTIDRQRIAAVKALEAMGYRFREDKWLVPDATGGSPEADAMHAQLVHRADQLEGCTEGFRGRAGAFSHRERDPRVRTKALAGRQHTGRQGLLFRMRRRGNQ